MLHSEIFYAFLVTAVSLAVVATVLSRLKVPTIVGFVLAGVLIGPSGLHWIKSLPAAQTISELGIIFLMFALGLEISLDHLRKLIRPLLNFGLTQVAGTILLAQIFFIFALGFSPGKSFVLASCLALSSTAVILKLMQDKRETETPYGRVNVTILLFQDMAALPLMAAIPALSSLSTSSQSGLSLIIALSWIALFLLGSYLVGRYVIPFIFSHVTKTTSREVFFFSIISVTFIIAFLAEKSGLSMSLGAFVAGVLISESPYNKQALAELSPLRDIFLGFFFASVGMLVDLKFIYLHAHHLLWLIPAMFLLKFTVIYFVTRINTKSHGVSIASAISLTQIGEFSFILAASSHAYGIIANEEFQYFLSMAVCSLIATPLLYYYGTRGSGHSNWTDSGKALGSALRLHKANDKDAPEELRDEANISESSQVVAPRKTIVVGVGHAGRRTLVELTHNGIPCVGVDLNHENIKHIREKGIAGVYGDSTTPEVLESAGILNAYLVIITVNGKHITPKILTTIRKLNPEVKVLIRVHYIQELNEISNFSEQDVIVSESETANTIIRRALGCYGLGDPNLPTA